MGARVLICRCLRDQLAGVPGRTVDQDGSVQEAGPSRKNRVARMPDLPSVFREVGVRGFWQRPFRMTSMALTQTGATIAFVSVVRKPKSSSSRPLPELFRPRAPLGAFLYFPADSASISARYCCPFAPILPYHETLASGPPAHGARQSSLTQVHGSPRLVTDPEQTLDRPHRKSFCPRALPPHHRCCEVPFPALSNQPR